MVIVTNDVCAQDESAYVLRELWRIGGVVAPESEQFSGPFLATALGPGGEAAILDQARDLVSVFDQDGRFLFHVGGAGVDEVDHPIVLCPREGPECG